jgi:hypothetical protein
MSIGRRPRSAAWPAHDALAHAANKRKSSTADETL